MVSDLAKIMNVTKPVVTRALNTLGAQNLVDCRRNTSADRIAR